MNLAPLHPAAAVASTGTALLVFYPLLPSCKHRVVAATSPDIIRVNELYF
ncbi:hypothetical protein GMORB2_7010 [Geosmithia morbida]|uniref:Uncharacterized protein n=1 Tax=Geosmithia morbida TaxID=1094350 RepID=A0A9P5D0G3_9HYPO|nr:uncharacterized protein GMORB2_7010 [Geosmithia morbida]KAF4122703.1 hypothetical protein GMORB2_7010 [Geosmithia morbida]